MMRLVPPVFLPFSRRFPGKRITSASPMMRIMGASSLMRLLKPDKPLILLEIFEIKI
jgi:hypothetical protein